jgi:hypothetical protein
MAAVPALSFAVGIAAFPRPQSAADERASFEKSDLGPAVRTTRPTPNSPADALLDDSIRVLGADLPKKPVAKGDKLEVTFHFGCEAELDRDWQVFVHVDAKGGSSRIHGDHFPVRGQYDTTLWKEGVFIADAWSTTVPRDAAPGSYDVWVGFYIGDDRLPFSSGDARVHDGQDRVRVGTVEIE